MYAFFSCSRSSEYVILLAEHKIYTYIILCIIKILSRDSPLTLFFLLTVSFFHIFLKGENLIRHAQNRHMKTGKRQKLSFEAVWKFHDYFFVYFEPLL
jgi:hypothetical protein